MAESTNEVSVEDITRLLKADVVTAESIEERQRALYSLVEWLTLCTRGLSPPDDK